MTQKTRLLETGMFLDNEYLDKYIELISSCALSERTLYSTQRHHILPVAYYKKLKLPVDNSNSNVVLLAYKNHILAHYYLTFCTVEWLRGKTASAFMILTALKEYLSEAELVLDLPRLEELYTYGIQNRAESSKIANLGKHTNNHTGKIYMNDGVVNVCVFPEYAEELYEQGFVKGRLTSDQARENMSSWQKGKSKPSLLGREKSATHKAKIADANVGRVYLVDSEGNEKSFHREDPQIQEYLDTGIWIVGRKPFTEERKSNLSKSLKGRVSPRKGYKCTEDERYALSTHCVGRIWVHNDTHSKMIYPQELDAYLARGYVEGRLSWKRKSLKQEGAV